MRSSLSIAGHVLQLTHSYASLFAIASSAYLLGLVILCLLAPGLKESGGRRHESLLCGGWHRK